MLISNFDDLPSVMKNKYVFKYYQILSKKRIQLFFKRIIDIILSSFAIILSMPVIILIAICIKCTSNGSVFFKQIRVGKNNKNFKILKFRTMVTNADKKGIELTTKNDCRITKFGAFLRKTNMDEMPQIFNVFMGQMTIIGTRPEVPKYVKHYTEEMYATLLTPPGMLSEASIKYKNENDLLVDSLNPEEYYIDCILPDKMKCNLEYYEKFSIWYDFVLIFKSIKSGFEK